LVHCNLLRIRMEKRSKVIKNYPIMVKNDEQK